ncbi:MAG: UDP-N-acetylglucosamine 2-epimerase (non-hydrolyzing) [Bacteroidales bacterium]|nr:UDP-N-acetylglucosamine 2-epimerase (non-hydrolyzing) [Bacteroidales bacterium]
MKIITIVGARPQFIKAAAISRAIKKFFSERIEELIMHSGQHYDDNMSRVFFEEMAIPHPKFNLEVGSGTHGFQTGEIIRRTEQVLLEEKPDMVLVYGDTNTTLAGSLAASKLRIPVAHIEAGLRSFNKSMPEEINRVVCDHLSTFLFSPTQTGFKNLAKEGFDPDAQPPYTIDHPGIYHCGDVMYDNALYYSQLAEERSKILSDLALKGKDFILCTIHRDSNTDSADRLNAIMGSLDEISRDQQIDFVLPLHPRTVKMMPVMLNSKLQKSIEANPFLRMTGPVTYFDMLLLENRCRMIITDSGGVQKESYFFRKPCLVLRSESEWKELIELGTATIVDADPKMISDAFYRYYNQSPDQFPAIFGDGHAAEFILNELVKFLP